MTGSVEVKLNFDPTLDKLIDDGNYFGFMLNPEFGTYDSKQTRFKEDIANNAVWDWGCF